MVISMIFHQIERNASSSFFVSVHNFIDDEIALFCAVFKFKWHQFCICFFRHIIQTNLFDLQLVTDWFDTRKCTVEFGQNCINCSGCENCFACVVITSMSVEYFCICLLYTSMYQGRKNCRRRRSTFEIMGRKDAKTGSD